MAEYTLVVRIPQAGNHEVTYSLTLNRLYESYPADYFRDEQHRTMLCQAIQDQSKRQVSPTALEAMITQWIADIRCGLYRTVVTLELPPETYFTADGNTQSITNTNNLGSPTPIQTIPFPIPLKPKPPVRDSTNSNLLGAPLPSAATKTQPKDSLVSQPDQCETPVEEPPPPDVRSDTNRADF